MWFHVKKKRLLHTRWSEEVPSHLCRCCCLFPRGDGQLLYFAQRVSRAAPSGHVNPHQHHRYRPGEGLGSTFQKVQAPKHSGPEPLLQWTAESMASEGIGLSAWDKVLNLQKHFPPSQFWETMPAGSLPWPEREQAGPCHRPVISDKTKSLSNVTEVQNLAAHYQLLFCSGVTLGCFFLGPNRAKCWESFCLLGHCPNHLTVLLFVPYTGSQ